MTKQHERNHLSVLCDQVKLLYKSSLKTQERKNQRVLLCILALFYSIIPFITVAYFARVLLNLFD